MTLARGAVRPRTILRWSVVLLYFVAAWFHLTEPAPFVRITPDWVPAPHSVVAITGVAEALGAAGLAQPFSSPLRRAAGAGLALYALCVWPANINHMMLDLARPDRGWGLEYHIPRMLAQPLLIWLALWTSGLIDWPARRFRQ